MSYIVGLDIGTSLIKAAVAENDRGRPHLLAVFKEPSAGFRRGTIVDLAEASPAISRTLNQIKKKYKSGLKNVYMNIGTPQIKVQNSKGVAAISRSDSEIYKDDVERAVKASQAMNLGANRMIIHNVIREFIVDGIGDISDPLGLSGSRLEVNSLIIDAFAPHLKNLIRAAELAGAHISGLVLDSLISSRAVLSKTQKDIGVLLVDIGFGTTSLCIFEENKLVGAIVIPLGAGNITKDLAVGLKISLVAAENLKTTFGYALAKEINTRETIELKKFSPQESGTVTKRFVAEIIEARLAEIFEFVNNELKLLGKTGQLAGGVVLTGGGAKLPGLTELAKQELKLSAQIGLASRGEWANELSEFSDVFEEPEFVNALGLVLWGTDQEDWRNRNVFSKVKLGNFWKNFLP